MRHGRRYEWVLSVYATTRGFGFVVFEGSEPFDWGVKEVRGARRNDQCVQNIALLIERHDPQAIVLRSAPVANTPGAARINGLNGAIEELADRRGIPVFTYARAQVRKRFAYLGVPTKHLIAQEIARHVPAFERYLPPLRRAWMSEDARMGLFDAAALALVFMHSKASAPGESA